jgi:putative acetyltransferase
MPSTDVRRAQPADYAGIVLLWSRSLYTALPDLRGRFSSDHFLTRLNEVEAGSGDIWVIEDAGVISGFATVKSRLIRNLFIVPERQGQGLGTRMLDHLKRHYGAPLFVQTLDVHWRARAFYGKTGFEWFAQRPSGFEGLTDVIYRWDGPSGSQTPD